MSKFWKICVPNFSIFRFFAISACISAHLHMLCFPFSKNFREIIPTIFIKLEHTMATFVKPMICNSEKKHQTILDDFLESSKLEN